MTRISIDPITRLEGHGKIEIFLGDDNRVERAFFQVPELRGFEKFAVGRPAEEMPQITSRICGVCPTAHHMASTKALDSLYQVEPPPAARKIRELFYSAFYMEDHALHFYYLGGPDFIVGPGAPKAERNVLGVIGKVGTEIALKVISTRRRLREILTALGGKPIHPVLGLPGGVAKRVTSDMQAEIQRVAADAVSFAEFSLEAFDNIVLKNSDYVNLILSGGFTHRTYYMGMVDEANRTNFYDGTMRVTGPGGEEYARFALRDYADYIAERTEPWSYMKFCYLKPLGWKGFIDESESGVYAVAPLARLNVADSLATPLAQQAADRYFQTLGGKPVHHTLATHWARLIEMLYAAERLRELAADEELTSPEIRTIPEAAPNEGVGIVEAPRGTLIHHYQTDEKGLIRKANLIVATQNNAARIAMSVEKAARELLRGPEVPEELLNTVEMAFRAYDPCLGCATHALTAGAPLLIRVWNLRGELLSAVGRDAGGKLKRY
jgi:F420-non-reducing hydrogenase large subunit